MKSELKNRFHLGMTLFLTAMAVVFVYYSIFEPSKMQAMFGFLGGMLSPIIWGMIMAYLVWAIVKVVERWFNKLLPEKTVQKRKGLIRGVSILIGFLVIFGALVILLSFLLPSLVDTLGQLLNNLSSYQAQVEAFIATAYEKFPMLEHLLGESSDKAMDQISQWLSEFLSLNLASMVSTMSSGLVTIGTGFLNFIIGLIIATYLLSGKEKFLLLSRKLVIAAFTEERAQKLIARWNRFLDIFDGFVIGKIFEMIVMGVICFAFMTICGIPYAVLISVLVALTNLVPYIGPWFSGIPSILLLLMVDPVKALIFGVFFMVLQQLDGQIIGPRIMSDRLGLSAFWIIVAIVIGGGMAGAVGMFFGIPVFAFLYECVREWTYGRLKKKGLNPELKPIGVHKDPENEATEGTEKKADSKAEKGVEPVSEKEAAPASEKEATKE